MIDYIDGTSRLMRRTSPALDEEPSVAMCLVCGFAKDSQNCQVHCYATMRKLELQAERRARRLARTSVCPCGSTSHR